MTTPLKPDHEKRPFRFKLEGPFLRVSTMLLITPISPNFKGLKCSVFGRFRALQSRNIYGENMFDDFFDGSFFGGHSPLFGKHARNLMKTDIRETDDAKAYRFAVELPGFEKDEIHVDVQDGYLTVSAEKGLDKDEENKKGRVLRQERYSGACSRSFYVGDVKPEDVKAKYESGVLTVLIPKEEPKKLTSSSKIAIE